MSLAQVISVLTKTVTRLGALEERTKDVRHYQERIEEKYDKLSERVTRLEEQYENLSKNVKLEIRSELQADFTRIQTLLDEANKK